MRYLLQYSSHEYYCTRRAHTCLFVHRTRRQLCQIQQAAHSSHSCSKRIYRSKRKYIDRLKSDIDKLFLIFAPQVIRRVRTTGNDLPAASGFRFCIFVVLCDISIFYQSRRYYHTFHTRGLRRGERQRPPPAPRMHAMP